MKRRTEQNNLNDLLSDFILEKRAQGLADKSILGYQTDLTKFLSKVDDIKTIDSRYFTNYVNDLLTKMKPVSVNHYIRCYRAFLYWCMNNGYLKEYKIKLVKEQEAPLKIYSEEDIHKLLTKPTKKDTFGTWRAWAITAFVMGTGARAGTIINIKLEDIDLNTQEVVYRHTKNKKSAIVPLCDNLVSILKSYIREFAITDYLFPTDENNQMNVYNLNRAFQRYCKLRDVEFKSVHAFRHTFAKQFILNGGNPFQLQKMLDHQSLTMSQHYTHLFGSDLHGVVNDFSPLAKIKDKEKITRKS